MLDANLEAQIAPLAARYGEPRRVAVELAGRPFSPMSDSDRIGEVCMVLRRKNGQLLTAIKTFYPPGAFRLLTGGIHLGEAIEAALLRETWEETGLDVEIARFLAVIEYRFADNQEAEESADFATFAFLLDERGGELAPQDPNERLGAFREVSTAELPLIADTLAHVEDTYSEEIEGCWGDWGKFRAVVHEVVFDLLRSS